MFCPLNYPLITKNSLEQHEAMLQCGACWKYFNQKLQTGRLNEMGHSHDLRDIHISDLLTFLISMTCQSLFIKRTKY